MKTTIYLFLALFLAFSTFTFAQTEEEKDAIKNTFAKIVEISKQKDFSNAKGLLAYSGENEERNLKSPLNLDDPDDSNIARRIMRKIKALFDISDSYSVLAITKNTKNNISLYVLTANFKSGAQNLTSNFTFVKINNNFLLVYAE